MCYVIITCWSLLWTLFSITTFMLIIASIMSPHWLVGAPRKIGLDSIYDNITGIDPDKMFSPTIGIFNRCTRLHKSEYIEERENCATYATGYDMPDAEFPHAWKASIFFFGIGAIILLFCAVTSILSICNRSLCGKSIFTVSGLMQSIADGYARRGVTYVLLTGALKLDSSKGKGLTKLESFLSLSALSMPCMSLLCIIGLILYPAGWGSDLVDKYCGSLAAPFYMDRCTLGWAFYVNIMGTVLTFLCSFLSVKADGSTSSYKVEEEVLEGKNLICVV